MIILIVSSELKTHESLALPSSLFPKYIANIAVPSDSFGQVPGQDRYCSTDFQNLEHLLKLLKEENAGKLSPHIV